MCSFERGLVLVRNPFDAIISEFNHHKAGKTKEADLSVYEEAGWPKFAQEHANNWLHFHNEWLNT